MKDDVAQPGRKQEGHALHTLQVLLSAEVRFLDTLETHARSAASNRYDNANILPRLNHENIFHIARFLFLLRELRCDSPAALGRFIDAHNTRVRELIETRDFSRRSEAELQKAIISKQRKFVMLETVSERGHVAFARREIADLLFDHMSRDRANAAVDILWATGLLKEISPDSFDKSNRRPVFSPSGVLEDAYQTYLTDISQGITEARQANNA